MAEDDDLYCQQQQLIGPSMVFIRESPIFDHVVFPPIYHENLQVASSIYGVDKYLESPSESSSPSSSSRRSGSSSSFSLFPSDSDGQPSLTAPDRKSPLETEQISPPSLSGDSPPSNSDEQSPLEQKSPRFPSELGGESSLCDSDGNFLRKPLNGEVDVFRCWWEILLVRVYSKLKNLVTWFSATLRPFYPVLAIAIWWWMRIRARRKRVKGETLDHLRDAIKERDEV